MQDIIMREDQADKMLEAFSESKAPSFSELQDAEYSEGWKSLGLMGIGAAASGKVDDFVAGKISGLGSKNKPIASIAAGLVLKMVIKKPMVKDIATGLIIAGIAGMAKSYGGNLFGEGYATNMDSAPTTQYYSENRMGGVTF